MAIGSRPKAKSQHGAVAQLGEHLLCKQGVTGSIPVSSTNILIRYFQFDAFLVRASTWKQVRLGGQVSTASGLARFGERSRHGCLTTKLIG